MNANTNEAHCGDCGKMLEPGAGRRWQGERPCWCSGHRAYLCEDCLGVWLAWREMLPAQLAAQQLTREWIERRLPGRPVPAMDPGGRAQLTDQRAVCQAEVWAVVMDGTWWVQGRVAQAVADSLAALDEDLDDYVDVVELAVLTRDAVLERVGRVIDLDQAEAWRML